jgi:hypothetical protein
MKTLGVLVVCLMLSIPCQARVIFVDSNAPGPIYDGSSWANAYKYLQDALADASSSGDVDEIWVAQGIYKPDCNSAEPNGTGNREATFQLINGVALRGGYAGFGEPDSNARDIKLYETVLSGDLDGNDEPNFANYGDNSYHVVTSSEADLGTVFDGFVIAGGNSSLGSGMYNYNDSSPTVSNCTFTGNAGGGEGGGMYNNNYCNPIISNCTFSNNSGGIRSEWYCNPIVSTCTFRNNSGTGMLSYIYCNPTVSDCLFIDNSGPSGGGMGNYWHCVATVSNCIFIDNSSGFGGGMKNTDSSVPILNNCIFIGNIAVNGGAIGCYAICNPIINNCTFSGNYAPTGAVISFQAPWAHPTNYLTMVNCIVWNGADWLHLDEYSNIITITYSDVQAGWPGEGNIDVDPCFADPNNGDYHLKSEAGRWNPTKQRWVYDEVTSLCIDAGYPNSSVGLEPNPNGGRINMGAYGGTAEASKSYCANPIDGDINGDCVVDFKDFAIMASHWLEDNRQ